MSSRYDPTWGRHARNYSGIDGAGEGVEKLPEWTNIQTGSLTKGTEWGKLHAECGVECLLGVGELIPVHNELHVGLARSLGDGKDVDPAGGQCS